jgi:uncharacterized protein YdaU (DUF1376 family)
VNFYAFNIGDYAGATRHLSWDEDMAYRRMLDAYYSRETPLPLDRRQVYRLVGASEGRQREAVDAILIEFFEERHDGWHNNRADEEIAKAALKKEKAKQSAAVRWHDHAHTDRNANASNNHANASTQDAKAMPTHSEGNAPNPNPNPNPIKEEDDAAARARRRELFDQTDAALKAIVELKTHPVAASPVIAPIFGLVLDKGYDLHTQIIPSIRRQLITAKGPIKGWGYFVGGIIQDASQPKPNAGATNGSHRQKPTRDETFAAIERRINQLREAES